MRPIAILSAMQEEIADLRAALIVDDEISIPAGARFGDRAFHAGTLWGVPVVLAWSRWGKVAAAVTTTHVLASFRPRAVVFTGVAGSLQPGIRIGDVVIADGLVQHDIDARPFFPQHEVPSLGLATLPCDPVLQRSLALSASRFLAHDLSDAVGAGALGMFGITSPQAWTGQIVSGDQFVSGTRSVAELLVRLPRARCVEMEGAAVAQVCYEHATPCAVVRVISDAADDNAGHDFPAFLDQVASAYTHGILRRFLNSPDGG